MTRETDCKRTSPLTWIVLVFALLGFGAIGVLYPPRGHPREVSQFHSMEAALELYNNKFDGYPPSDANDPTGRPYCGAMKLAEALMGQDMIGFHGDSVFRADGKDANGVTKLYLPVGVSYDRTMDLDLTARYGPVLPPESADCLTLAQIYGQNNTGSFDPNCRVLCDEYHRRYKSGRKAGMPVLYYKADTSKTAHDVNDPDNPESIYDYRDNHALLALGVPGEPEKKHPMFADPKLFYKVTRSDKATVVTRPFRADAYILISAGLDGLYGTKDDICNFEFNFPEQ